ncbi:MAG: hypothetical protein QM499_10540, partial [Flavobacteriaceae bacterium]
MKKITLLITLFICAIGFSQHSSSLSEWTGQNPQPQNQEVTVVLSKIVDASTNANTMGEYNPLFVRKFNPLTNVRSADVATMASNSGENNPVIINSQRIVSETNYSTQADCSASNPSNGFEDGRGNNATNVWTSANDIIVPMGSDLTLSQVTSFEFMAPGITVVSADITIYEDNAGLPGALVTTENVVPTSNTVVGSNFGLDISEVVFDITPVMLAGDVAMDV